MLSPRIIAFFVCSGVSSFHAVALGRLIPSFIDNCICLVWSWCTWIVTTFIFFTDFISWIPINVCTYNIITICVVINCPFISLKIFLAVFNWFCNFFYWFKWIIYFCIEKINIFFAFFNCNLVFTTKGGIVSVVL